MKIALAQLDTTVGDLRGNGAKILDFYRRGAAAGANLVMTPEMAITGYPPRDLLAKHRFVDDNLRELEELAAQVGHTALLVGYVDFNPTANTDVAPTITQILGTLPNIGPGGIAPAGRAMAEALTSGSRSAGGSHTQTMTANLMLQGVEAVTTIHVTWIGDEPYLDSSSVEHKPLGSSP